MKLIVAGGRNFNDYEKLKSTLDNMVFNFGEVTEIVSGNAKGADKLGERYAKENNIPIKRFIPDWEGLGKKAGFVRNRQMGDYAKEHNGMLVAFWDGESRGTKGMIDYAKRVQLNNLVVMYYPNEAESTDTINNVP